MRLLIILVSIFCCLSVHAKTTLTLINQKGWSFSPTIDSVKISRFSDERPLIISYKDSMILTFLEPYADLYSVSYLHNGSIVRTWQRWLDTGMVTVKINLDGFDIKLVTNSPLTQRVEKFYIDLGYYKKRTDTTTVNDLLINTYKENIGNPFSFAVGRIFYEYNEQNRQRIFEMNAIEREQPAVIKKSIFYAMMIRERFRYSEKLFINYFNNTVLLNSAGQETSNPFDKGKYNIVFFAGKATPATMEEFRTFSSKWTSYDPKDFNFYVIYSTDKEKWQLVFQKSGIPYFQLISEQNFTSQTLCHPDTKFYIVDGVVRIPGFYDSFSGVVNHFKDRR
jgi:hypothetical protein